jgi:hypothetical protein
MLNGTWMISAAPPAGAVKLCPHFLPAGTLVKLSMQGASRHAVEEGRDNELAGTLTLLPPLSPLLCRTGIGAVTGFGTNFCVRGELEQDANTPVEFTDAIFSLSRWDAASAADPDNFFYAQEGARPGALFTHLILKDKGVEWHLWMKNQSEMVARCIATLPGRRNFRSFPLVWKEMPTGQR